jgi:putative adenylate-forming enzyme
MLGRITVGLSSGTSGNRGLFLVSGRERAKWVAAVWQKVLPKKMYKGKIAFFLRANSNLYTSVKSKRWQFHFFDLMQPLSEHLERLATLSPEVLVAPPSVLLRIAHRQAEGKVLIHPKKIISVAEVLEPADRKEMEAVFGQTVHQVYQCTEGFLASSCAFGVLHFHEDRLRIEKEYLPGNPACFYPIITDFNRITQPIVRYKLNDLVHERTTACPCGSVMLAIDHIEGRADDIFEFSGAGGQKKQVFPDFIRRVMLSSEAVQEYVVEQTAPAQLLIHIQAQNFEIACRELQEAFGQFFKENGLAECELIFNSDLPLLRDAKLRRIKRRFQED